MKDILDNIDYNFEIVPVTSDKLLEEHFRLRYQVYCVENSFFDTKSFPEKMETDIYDDHSVHSLIRHRGTGLFIAGVRLILPNLLNLKDSFPLEQNFSIPLLDDLLYSSNFSRKSLAEISRLIVSRDAYKKIKMDAEFNRRGCCLLSTVTITLFKAIVQMSVKHKITHAYALMVPAMVRLLKRFYIIFTPIGPLVEYYGSRIPCLIDGGKVLSLIYQNYFDLWDYITEGGILWQAAADIANHDNDFSLKNEYLS